MKSKILIGVTAGILIAGAAAGVIYNNRANNVQHVTSNITKVDGSGYDAAGVNDENKKSFTDVIKNKKVVKKNEDIYDDDIFFNDEVNIDNIKNLNVVEEAEQEKEPEPLSEEEMKTHISPADKEEDEGPKLSGHDLIVPTEAGYDIQSKIKQVLNDSNTEDNYENVTLFDGIRYYRETTGGLLDGSRDYCDIESGLWYRKLVYDGKSNGWEKTRDLRYPDYASISERDSNNYENLKSNKWDFVEEKNGELIFKCINGRSVHSNSYVDKSHIYTKEKYYDVEQTIYIDAATNRLNKLIEKNSCDVSFYDYTDEYRISELNMTMKFDYEEEHVINAIGEIEEISKPDGI